LAKTEAKRRKNFLSFLKTKIARAIKNELEKFLRSLQPRVCGARSRRRAFQNLYEGKHQPVISKKIFDIIQTILKQKRRPHHKTKNEPQAFCGMLKCGTCGMGNNWRIQGEKTKEW